MNTTCPLADGPYAFCHTLDGDIHVHCDKIGRAITWASHDWATVAESPRVTVRKGGPGTYGGDVLVLNS